ASGIWQATHRQSRLAANRPICVSRVAQIAIVRGTQYRASAGVCGVATTDLGTTRQTELLRSRTLRTGLAAVCALLSCAAVAATPVASATEETCTITVVTQSGQKMTFVVNQSGSSSAPISVPGNQPVKSATESCTP